MGRRRVIASPYKVRGNFFGSRDEMITLTNRHEYMREWRCLGCGHEVRGFFHAIELPYSCWACGERYLLVVALEEAA
jgi:hypothetical protein